MKAIILAAGKGERMNSSLPKPLHKLFGLSLIERVIIPLIKAGIKELIVVLGYKGEKIEKYLRKKFRNIKIQFVYNKEYYRGNGVSFLYGAGLLKEKEKFLLLMADHIYSPEIIERVLKEEKPLMVVHNNFNLINNLEKETKVKIDNGYVSDIGRDLKDFDGIDCGIFLLEKNGFSLPKELFSGEIELSYLIKEYVKREKLKAFFIKKNEYVFNVNDQETKEWVSNYLLNNSGKKEDGIISKIINRKISRLLTKILCNYSVQPLVLTIVNFLLTIVASLAFFFSNQLGGLLVQFVSIFDGVDGEIARIKLATTKFGAYLDSVFDRYSDTIIISAIAFTHYLKTNQIWIFLFAFLAIIGSNMSMILKDKERLLFSQNIYHPLIPLSRDLRLFLIFLFSLFNQPFLAIIILAFLTNLSILLRILLIKRIAKED
ncbi:MAG: NTP transferase domain-containing protein [candidate division WOR-3 bacterium]